MRKYRFTNLSYYLIRASFFMKILRNATVHAIKFKIHAALNAKIKTRLGTNVNVSSRSLKMFNVHHICNCMSVF